MSSKNSNDSTDAMFIADLHLHPEMPEITNKFFSFISWAAHRTKSLYILGDFLHVWPGDDAMDDWSNEIASRLAWLSGQGVKVFYMAGNRDFLLGRKFLTKAKMQEIKESTVIKLGGIRVLLVHGDRYCTKDRSHQYLRRLTRNSLFKLLFLKTPYAFRRKIVNTVRQYSQNSRKKPSNNMLVVPSVIAKHLRRFDAKHVIHGHTHLPGLTTHADERGEFYQYVLSDWDENPLIMCYNNTKKFHYSLFAGDL
ncbi:MAG: UDP-2,3-diacylglucosamine diphosphatase [Legionellaceae bacterium]|nr:UDP-2,3-diacylglucosamine diphosphatase [Legionellaceae bacterium]